MGYKQKKSIIQGTDKHKSALKYNIVDFTQDLQSQTPMGSTIDAIKSTYKNIGRTIKFGKSIYNAFTKNKSKSKPKSKPKSKRLSYEASYTKKVADKWKDKGGKAAYIKAAKEWNKKNRR